MALEQGDLGSSWALWQLVHKMNPAKFDVETAQKESWAYLESRHKRIGYTPFIKEVAQYISVPNYELKIDDDKAHRIVTFYIPQSKRFTMKQGDEIHTLVANNNYTMKIKGGSVIKFYGSEEALKWLADVIKDSGINQLKYVPENVNYARLKKANGKKGDPIDVVKIMHGMYCELDTKGDEKRDGGTMWDVEYIHPKYRVSKGIVELPTMLYYSKHKTF